MEIGVLVGVVVIGFVHGVLPDHGWPIAATYALNRQRRFVYGLLAALILGIGHLISSVVLVLAYFWFSTFAAFAESPWMAYVAGTILILLGIHEYRHGGHGHLKHDHHGHDDDPHDHGDDHHAHADDNHGHLEHDHGDDHNGHDDVAAHTHTDGGAVEHDHSVHHDHESSDDHGHGPDEHGGGRLARLRGLVPGGGHDHLTEEHAQRGLAALGATALLLGFAHEEPIQILAICVGTDACLELMLLYSLAVIVAIVLPTMLLIAGYEHHRERIEQYTPYLPTITAIALIGMGLAFITGLI